MATRQQISSEIELLLGLGGLVEAYQQIAASRMRRIREAVVSKRDFLQEIAQIFQQVKASYEKEIVKLMQEKKILRGEEVTKLTLLQRNGRTAYVLLTANTGLYGDVVRKTTDLFFDYQRRGDGDPVIIGRFGRALFEHTFPQVEYTYFDFPDNKIELEHFSWIAEHLIRYKRIFVFHGQFKNIVSQEPVVSSVSGDELTIPGQEEQEKIKEEERLDFLFEPTLEDVMVFFENEIVALILEQAVFEGQLAKFASRMWIMEKAQENIEKGLEKMQSLKRLVKHREDNKKQQEVISGRSLW